jgi:cysteinyl-tRNA synthetase
MDDDFNTPAALAALFGLATEINRVSAAAVARSAEGSAALEAASAVMQELLNVLGLDLSRARSAAENDLAGPLMEIILSARQALRGNKDYAAADALRARLKELGIVVEDRPEGASWRKATV